MMFAEGMRQAHLLHCEPVRVCLVALTVHHSLDLPLRVSQAVIPDVVPKCRVGHACCCRRTDSGILRRNRMCLKAPPEDTSRPCAQGCDLFRSNP